MVLLFQKLNHSFQITMYSYFFLTTSQFPWPHGILRSVQLDSESVRPLRFGGELWGMTPPKKKTENPNVMNIEVLISIWFLQYIYTIYKLYTPKSYIHMITIYEQCIYINSWSLWTEAWWDDSSSRQWNHHSHGFPHKEKCLFWKRILGLITVQAAEKDCQWFVGP